ERCAATRGQEAHQRRGRRGGHHLLEVHPDGQAARGGDGAVAPLFGGRDVRAGGDGERAAVQPSPQGDLRRRVPGDVGGRGPERVPGREEPQPPPLVAHVRDQRDVTRCEAVPERLLRHAVEVEHRDPHAGHAGTPSAGMPRHRVPGGSSSPYMTSDSAFSTACRPTTASERAIARSPTVAPAPMWTVDIFMTRSSKRWVCRDTPRPTVEWSSIVTKSNSVR